MKAMFSECYCLTHLDLKNFNTSEVRNMRTMFGKCSELQFLDVSNFDISNVRYFEFMFYKCYKLKDFKGIDIFISKNISNVKGIFEECFELENTNEFIAKINRGSRNIKKKEIHVNFLSSDQHIKFSINCYNTDLFSKIEGELYKKFPELMNKNVIFLCSGNIAQRKLSLEQNGIKEETTIIINFNDYGDK